jgi:hypothetical protein
VLTRTSIDGLTNNRGDEIKKEPQHKDLRPCWSASNGKGTVVDAKVGAGLQGWDHQQRKKLRCNAMGKVENPWHLLLRNKERVAYHRVPIGLTGKSTLPDGIVWAAIHDVGGEAVGIGLEHSVLKVNDLTSRTYLTGIIDSPGATESNKATLKSEK